jgi:putative lipoprotein (rSAM/lipoprotein system)
MKTIRVNFIKASNVIIVSLLAILGFASSCEKTDPKVEYGTPSAKFIVNGKIESKDSNAPVKNIRVIMQGDTSLTDLDGKYQVIQPNDFPSDKTYDIKFQDFDGISNGNLENLDTVVTFTDPQFTDGDGHWYSGEVEKDFNVKLKTKQ